MNFRKLPIALACITLSAFSTSFATTNSNYAGVLHDANDGLSLLEDAQYSMLSINNSKELSKMIELANKAASCTYASSDLAVFDAKFQQYKNKYAAKLADNRLAGAKIFNSGNLIINKGQKSVVVDLMPRDTSRLGIASDNISTIESAKTAINHLDIAITNMTHWIQESNEKININKSFSDAKSKENKYFNSAQLYFKTYIGTETTLQDIEGVRNEIINMLIQIQTMAIQAASDKTTPAERADLATQFSALSSEINRVVYTATFSYIRPFDGSQLDIHETNGTVKSYDLPELTLKSVGIKDDDVLTCSGAQKSLQDLSSIQDKISIWLATGIYDSAYISTRPVIVKK